MTPALADQALTELVSTLEDLHPDSLERSVGRLLEERAFRSFAAASRLLRSGRGPRPGVAALRAVMEATDEAPEASDLDRFLLDSGALSALRARRVFLGRELMYRWRRSDPARPFRALSLGAGSHSELLELLAFDHVQSEDVEATVVDIDAASLGEVRQRAEQLGVDGSVRTIAADPRTFAAAGPTLPDQDVITCACQLDFMDDTDVDLVVSQAIDRLAPGGELLLAHWHDDLTAKDRLVLEGFLGWEPKFRSPRLVAHKVQQIAEERGVVLAGMLRGPNVYFVLQRG